MILAHRMRALRSAPAAPVTLAPAPEVEAARPVAPPAPQQQPPPQQKHQGHHQHHHGGPRR